MATPTIDAYTNVVVKAFQARVEDLIASEDINFGCAVLINSDLKYALADDTRTTMAIAVNSMNESLDTDVKCDSGDQLTAHYPISGEQFIMRLASGQNIAAGAVLKVSTNGELVATTVEAVVDSVDFTGETTTTVDIATYDYVKALEAVDNSGGTAPFIHVIKL